MPIVLSLVGQMDLGGDRKLSRSDARDWLARAAVWFEEVGDAILDAQLVRDAEDRPVLLVVIHPASPPVEVRLGATGKIRISATTTPAGPGYHQYLCHLFRQLTKDFAFTWVADDCSDPTGYFVSRNRAELERSFFHWLGEVCGRKPKTIGLSPLRVFHYPAEVLTPLGPRTNEWVAAVAAEPLCGTDFFPWWNASLDAEFYRNRALVRLWCDFTWRAPLTEQEGELADQIANDLATAFKLDPSAELPWSEWLELLTSIQADAVGEQFCVTPTDRVLSVELWKRAGPVLPSDDDAPRIGYRRDPMRIYLDGGWSVEVPGEFTSEWDEERNWTAWNATRTVWFRRVGFTKPDGSPPMAVEALEMGRRSLPEGEALPGIDAGGVLGVAVFGTAEEEGRTVWRLSGVAGADGQLAMCYVYTEDPADHDWAVRIWQSLRHG